MTCVRDMDIECACQLHVRAVNERNLTIGMRLTRRAFDSNSKCFTAAIEIWNEYCRSRSSEPIWSRNENFVNSELCALCLCCAQRAVACKFRFGAENGSLE